MIAASVSEAGRLVRSGETSAQALLEDAMDTASRTEAQLHAFLTIDSDGAREAAGQADADLADGIDRGPLHGIPVALKDNMCTRGVETTAASQILAGYVPPYDATVVTRLRSGGAVIVGKTNLDEFAMGSSTENSAYGTTYNPWDLSRVPGGSSGGSAASVAAGSSLLAFGSDTGGSIRQPASLCGVVGMKPTYGTVSRYGLIAFASSLDQIGPFARTVEDSALALSSIWGYDPLDSTSYGGEYPNPMAGLDRGVDGLRIGVVTELSGEGFETEVEAATTDMVARLEKAGVEVIEVSLPTFDIALSAYYLIAPAEAPRIGSRPVRTEPAGEERMAETPSTARQVHVYAGTGGHSAWFSDDSGQTWVHPNSHSGMYLEARVWSIASHPATAERLFAGSDMGIFRWDEPTARWAHLPSPMQDVWAVAIDPANPNVLIAGTRPAGFWRSADAGQTWSRLIAPGVIPASDVNAGPTRVTQVVFDPVDDGTVWATVEIGGVYRSKDRGATWEYKDKGLVSGDVHGLAVVRLPGGGKALLATTNRGLHRSEDNGETWVLQELPSPWPYTRSVVPRADNSGVVFVTNGNGPPGNDGFLLRSRDHGKTWENAKLPGPIESTVWCVATNAADPMLIFVCTNLGELFRSADGGESWTRLPHLFGELRALHWRPLPAGTRRAAHSLTRPVLKAAQMGWAAA